MAEKNTDLATRQGQGMARKQQAGAGNPFTMLERFVNEIDSMFDEFGLGRSWSAMRPGRDLLQPQRAGMDLWIPQMEVSQQNNELLVRADLPGMKRGDISVDITDDELVISGERQQDEKNTSGDFYRSERRYSSFYRTIPLPEGVMADQANATFKDGVLEIRMPAPPEQVTRGRKLEIKESSEKAPAEAKK